MPEVTITIQGLDELLRKVEGRTLLGSALRRSFERVGFAVESEAKERAPVFRSRLRNSITHETDPKPIPAWVLIGTNVKYAKAVHDGRKPGTWPPRRPLELWAQRKGIDVPVFLIQRKIAREGIKARPFLKEALDATQDRFQSFFDKAAEEIEQQWQA